MGMVTAGTDNPADTERELSSGYFQGTGIVAMNRKAAGMPAGTGKFVKLQAVNRVMKAETKLWTERFLLLLLIAPMI